ncbi:protein np24 [Phtheirospermum japonicum]|uniref:Protein np24 n=1 Tax=Phtheirospermum japonicum TaxID=374723 RepID=A0A830D498_9LAMI|nr:protein np24 [Phtheirospermum japonicum]
MLSDQLNPPSSRPHRPGPHRPGTADMGPHRLRFRPKRQWHVPDWRMRKFPPVCRAGPPHCLDCRIRPRRYRLLRRQPCRRVQLAARR